jgi:tetratricopeptide (TPR) repeat protein
MPMQKQYRSSPKEYLRRYTLIAVMGVLLGCCAVWSASAQRSLVVELYNRVYQLGRAGNDAEALETALQMLAVAERTYPPNDPQFTEVLYLVGEAYQALSRFDDAVAIFKRVLAIREKTYGQNHPKVGQALIAIGASYQSAGRFADAEPAYKRAAAIAEKSGNPDYIAIALNDLPDLYHDQGRDADAIPLSERALVNMRKAQKPRNTELATELDNLALSDGA